MKHIGLPTVTLLALLFLAPSGANAAISLSDEAQVILRSGTNLSEILKHTGKKMNVWQQKEGMRRYTNPLLKGEKGVSTSTTYSINNFIVYGTKSTKNLSAQKRYNYVKAFKAKNKELPLITHNWVDVLRMNSALKLQFERIADNCDALPDKLEKCASFKCWFVNPILAALGTPDFLNTYLKEIKAENGVCHYSEEMPNSGKLDCNYDEGARKVIARYYRDNATSTIEGRVSFNPETGPEVSIGSQAIYEFNGKMVANPLQEAMNDKQCIISGYASK